jgi:transcription initiation factor TFIIF subunit beta
MERRDLQQRLFQLFNEKPYWSITALKATLQQPDTWLREVLKDVAVLNREGQYANMWELSENWKDVGGGDSKPAVDKEDEDSSDEEEEEEEEDEDDLEVVPV